MLIICAAVLLAAGVEHLLRRLGIRPAELDETGSGFGDVLAALRNWAARRRR